MKQYTIRHLAVFLGLLAPSMVWAQAHPAAASAPRAEQHTREAPCLKQAGISPATWEQIQTIHKNILQQVRAVCENTSLTTDQKRQQVRGSFQKGQHQVRELLTPQQQEGYRACQQQRLEERRQNMDKGRSSVHPEAQYESAGSPAEGGLPDACMRLLQDQHGEGHQPQKHDQQQQPPRP